MSHLASVIDKRAAGERWRAAWLLLCLFCWGGTSFGSRVTTTEHEAPVPLAEELVVSAGEVSLEAGSSAGQLRQDFGLREGGRGGIDALRWVGWESGEWQISVDAQILENPDTVVFALEMIRPEEETLEVSVRHWTDFDNGAGPWDPVSAEQRLLSPQELEKQLSEVKVRYEKRLSELLLAQMAYRLFTRRGEAVSTRFGDDFPYRIGGRPSRRLIPALLESDETVQALEGGLVWQDGLRRTGVRARMQRREVDRVSLVERGVADAEANRWTRQRERTADDLFSLSAYSRREWSDRMVGSMGFAFTRLDGSVSGSRIFGANPEAAYDPEFAALQFEDRGYLDLDSRRQLRQWLFNMNLVTHPGETVRWMAGVRLEKLSTEVFGSYLDTYSTVDWAAAEFQRETADMLSRAERSLLDVSGCVEVRYIGNPKWLMYSRMEAGRQEGDLDENWIREEISPDTREPLTVLDRATDFDRATIFWEAGVKVQPHRVLQCALQVYFKRRDNGYSLPGTSLPKEDYTRYPGHLIRQEYQTRDINGRILWRVHPSLKLTARLDYQESTIDNTDRGLKAIESAERRRVMYHQTVTWRPSARFFLTAAYARVEDLTETVAADLGGVFSGIVTDLPNDYWQVDASAYMVLTKRIDLQLRYAYVEIDTYADLTPRTVPYGADVSLENASLGIVLHLSERVRTRVEYRYYAREEPSASGFNDYTAHLLSGTIQVIF